MTEGTTGTTGTTIEFKTEAQKAMYEQVVAWMKELYGTLTWTRENSTLVYTEYGSAVAYVAVDPLGEKETTLLVRSWVVTGAETTPELMKFLLTENNKKRFGAFGLDDQGDIFFDYTLIGSACTKDELRRIVNAVIRTSDEEDDKIMAQWGGQRAADR